MDCSMISELGNREINEDFARTATRDTLSCYVLADGLGGHGRGEVASEMAVEAVISLFEEKGELSAEFLAEAFEKAQAALLAKQAELRAFSDLKTTLTVLICDETSAIWGYIGDSRLYVFHRNKDVLRTLDHSVPQMLVNAREIKEKDIRLHPDRNCLLRVMGIPWEGKKYEISDVRPLSKCQAFLLCSDGFWECITEKEMCRHLKKTKTAQDWMALMLADVKKNGSGMTMDNHTAIAVRI